MEEEEKEEWRERETMYRIKVACSYYNGIRVEGKREPLIMLREHKPVSTFT